MSCSSCSVTREGGSDLRLVLVLIAYLEAEMPADDIAGCVEQVRARHRLNVELARQRAGGIEFQREGRGSFSEKLVSCALVSSRFTPMICNPCAPYLFCMSFIQGNE